jgi:hypothetical protein
MFLHQPTMESMRPSPYREKNTAHILKTRFINCQDNAFQKSAFFRQLFELVVVFYWFTYLHFWENKFAKLLPPKRENIFLNWQILQSDPIFAHEKRQVDLVLMK